MLVREETIKKQFKRTGKMEKESGRPLCPFCSWIWIEIEQNRLACQKRVAAGDPKLCTMVKMVAFFITMGKMDFH